MQATQCENPSTSLREAPVSEEASQALAIIAAARETPRAFEPLYRHDVGLVYHDALCRLRGSQRIGTTGFLTLAPGRSHITAISAHHEDAPGVWVWPRTCDIVPE